MRRSRLLVPPGRGRLIILVGGVIVLVAVLVVVLVSRGRSSTTAVPNPTKVPASATVGRPSLEGFPGASNTGVPKKTALTAYGGPCEITTPGTVIDAKIVTCTLVVKAAGVTITRSRTMSITDDFDGASLTIRDSEVDGTTSDSPAVGADNLTLQRVEVRGARVSVLCGSNCSITDSWLHRQYLAPGSDWHVNGYLSNGGSNVLLRHNTLACDAVTNSTGGGCTGPAASFGDFAPISDVVYDNNLFVTSPGAWCLYAGNDPGKPYGADPTGIVVKNNIFMRGGTGKCAAFGAATSFKSDGSGNAWLDNRWDDGSVVQP